MDKAKKKRKVKLNVVGKTTVAELEAKAKAKKKLKKAEVAKPKKKKMKLNVVERLPKKAPPKKKKIKFNVIKLTPKQEEQKKKVEEKRKDEPFMFDMWDEDVQELWEETGRSFKKLPKRIGEEVLYYHDFFNTDGSTTLSKRKTKNYNIPVYVDPDNGYSVGKTRWRDYSWDDLVGSF